MDPHVKETIKHQVDIQNLAERYDVIFRSNTTALCPFHEDKHPSASIKNGCFHCFVCNLHLDVFGFVQHMEKCSFNDAAVRLNEWYGLQLPIGRPRAVAHSKAIQRAQRRQNIPLENYRKDYMTHQYEFVALRHLITNMKSAGRYDLIGTCMGRMEALEEWFVENSWR